VNTPLATTCAAQIDWLKEPWTPAHDDDDDDDEEEEGQTAGNALAVPTIIAAGRATVIGDRRYRVYRPHNSARLRTAASSWYSTTLLYLEDTPSQPTSLQDLGLGLGIPGFGFELDWP